jgi:hypothetical protein
MEFWVVRLGPIKVNKYLIISMLMVRYGSEWFGRSNPITDP